MDCDIGNEGEGKLAGKNGWYDYWSHGTRGPAGSVNREKGQDRPGGSNEVLGVIQRLRKLRPLRILTNIREDTVLGSPCTPECCGPHHFGC